MCFGICPRTFLTGLYNLKNLQGGMAGEVGGEVMAQPCFAMEVRGSARHLREERINAGKAGYEFSGGGYIAQ